MTEQNPEQQGQQGQQGQQQQGQQQSEQQGQQQQQPQFITQAQLDEALSKVGTRTHHTGQQSQQQGQQQDTSVLDAINAQPERIVNAIREAFQKPKDDSQQQQQQTQQTQQQQEAAKPKSVQQRFVEWWTS